jgi:hypothetical protein
MPVNNNVEFSDEQIIAILAKLIEKHGKRITPNSYRGIASYTPGNLPSVLVINRRFGSWQKMLDTVADHVEVSLETISDWSDEQRSIALKSLRAWFDEEPFPQNWEDYEKKSASRECPSASVLEAVISPNWHVVVSNVQHAGESIEPRWLRIQDTAEGAIERLRKLLSGGPSLI